MVVHCPMRVANRREVKRCSAKIVMVRVLVALAEPLLCKPSLTGITPEWEGPTDRGGNLCSPLTTRT